MILQTFWIKYIALEIIKNLLEYRDSENECFHNYE